MSCRPPAAALALAAVLAARPSGAHAQEAPPPAVRVFSTTKQAYLTAELVAVSTYEYRVTYSVYYRGGGETLQESVILPVGVTRQREPKARRLHSAFLRAPPEPRTVTLLRCPADACRPEVVLPRVTRSALVVELPGPPLAAGEKVRLVAPEGVAFMESSAAGDSVPTPAISLRLPALSRTEEQLLQERPTLRVDAMPLARGREESGLGEASVLHLEGRLDRFARRGRTGLRLVGDIATERGVALDRIRLDAEAERDLRRDGYLPLTGSLAAETSPSLRTLDLLAGAAVEAQLPFSLNYSPRDEGYLPAAGPRVELRAEAGKGVAREEQPAADPVRPGAGFVRGGYAVRWRIPMTARTILRLHQAGEWLAAEDRGPGFHPLWDLALETQIGDLVYVLGYQRGEAAPLYRPIETTRLGVSLRFR